MADSIQDLLKSRQFQEPPEIGIIKSFIQDKFSSEAQITVKQTQIIIGVSNAALAGALRMQLHELQEMCQTKKRLIIRIG